MTKEFATIGKCEISTKDFAKHFFSILGIPFEERDSIHYEEGGYFKGIYNDIVFKVYASYRDDIRDMPVPMPLTIELGGKDPTAVDAAIDFILRSKLASEGYKFLQHVSGDNMRWIDFS